MQVFGIGILELSVILMLAVLVIGPDRLPGFASDLARWIRQARAYATHLSKDFNEVIGELEKEVGTSREDWKEIASVVNRHTGDVLKEVQKAADTAEKAGAIAAPNGGLTFASVPGEPPAANGNGNGGSYSANGTAVPPPIEQSAPLDEAGEPQTEAAAPAEEKPWYEQQTTSRRRGVD